MIELALFGIVLMQGIVSGLGNICGALVAMGYGLIMIFVGLFESVAGVGNLAVELIFKAIGMIPGF